MRNDYSKLTISGIKFNYLNIIELMEISEMDNQLYFGL